jgi:hypothetical protein
MSVSWMSLSTVSMTLCACGSDGLAHVGIVVRRHRDAPGGHQREYRPVWQEWL